MERNMYYVLTLAAEYSMINSNIFQQVFSKSLVEQWTC